MQSERVAGFGADAEPGLVVEMDDLEVGEEAEEDDVGPEVVGLNESEAGEVTVVSSEGGLGLGFRPNLGRSASTASSRRCAILHKFQL